jgi:hypothetical protein
MADDMVIGEPHPYAVASSIPMDPIARGGMTGTDDGAPPSRPSPQTTQRIDSPIELSHPPRSSPVVESALDNDGQVETYGQIPDSFAI